MTCALEVPNRIYNFESNLPAILYDNNASSSKLTLDKPNAWTALNFSIWILKTRAHITSLPLKPRPIIGHKVK